MDRPILYPQAVIRDTDALNAAKFAMVGLGWLAHALIQTNLPCVDGLLCSPASGLNASVAPGAMYVSEATDAAAYGSLGTDSHILIKQGLSLSAAAFSTPAPGSAGQSINYLIEVGYTDADAGSLVLPYYNAANPASPLNGPGNSGTSQPTLRQGLATLQLKAGTAATTGSQVTPTPDSGFIGLHVVTVNFGDTSLALGTNINPYVGTPWIQDAMAVSRTRFIAPVGDYTFDLTAIGTMVRHEDAGAQTYILPDITTVPIPDGAEFKLVNGGSAGTISLNAQSGATTILWAPSFATGNRTIGAGTWVDIIKFTTNVFLVKGSGAIS